MDYPAQSAVQLARLVNCPLDAAVHSNRGRRAKAEASLLRRVRESQAVLDAPLMFQLRLVMLLPALAQEMRVHPRVSGRQALPGLLGLPLLHPMVWVEAVRVLARSARVGAAQLGCCPVPYPLQSMGGRLEAGRLATNPVPRPRLVFLLSFRLEMQACHEARRWPQPFQPASWERDHLFHYADRRLLSPA